MKELKSDLAIADVLIGAGGLAYAKNMRSAMTISDAWRKVQHVVEENRLTSERVSTSEMNLDNIYRTMLKLFSSIKELSERCQLIGIAVPLSLPDANDDVLFSVAERLLTTSLRLAS